MARPLIQMALDSLDFLEYQEQANRRQTMFVIKDNFLETESYIKPIKTHIPKPSKNMYQTKRGKWVNCK